MRIDDSEECGYLLFVIVGGLYNNESLSVEEIDDLLLAKEKF